MKKNIFYPTVLAASVLLLLAASPAAFVHAQTIAPDLRAEITVTKDGAAHIGGFKVLQRVGSSYFGRLYWDETYLRVSLRGSSKTTLQSRFGETLLPEQIQIGDVLSADGELLSGTTEFSLNAKSIVDLSYEKNHRQFIGTVSSLDPAHLSFVLATSEGAITAQMSTSTEVTKGSRNAVGSMNLLAVGDRILLANGVYDGSSKILAVSTLTAYFDTTVLKPQNFKGTLTVLPTAKSTTLTVDISGQTYTLQLWPKTLLQNAKRQTTSLGRFQEGDQLIFYGARREEDLKIINVDLVRNLDL